ncbi:PTS sugar transporter subunit IIA [Rhizohabitans arisaemae]|uniref:PTS sugar transporter subunit IIA n=1 Tax=Rhizohabitans arisaemae TaxID=2720610 RepID=UPI0024B15A20|nr:PTS sugar transporter subunit IIA [Rhizohabitans arisaemae]
MREVLEARAVLLNEHAATREEAVERCGRLLVEIGAAAEPYIASMLERERSISTYVGEQVAIPHGLNREAVLRDAVCVVRFPGGVDWEGERVSLCVGIAARGDGHVALLAELAEILLYPERARALREAVDVETVLKELA